LAFSISLRQDRQFSQLAVPDRIQLYLPEAMSHTHPPHCATDIADSEMKGGFRPMTLLSMNEITTFRWSLEQDVENYQEAGYSGIGVWRSKLTHSDENEATELLLKSGLKVTQLSWAGGFTGSDGRTFAESVDDGLEAIRQAAAIRAGCLIIYAGGRNNHTFRHAGRLLRLALDELLPLAETVEIPLAIEPMHAACAHDWTFVTDLSSLLALIDEFSSPQLKIAYDTYHVPIHGRQQSVLRKIASQIGIVHLGDRRHAPSSEQERCPLGSGRLQLGEVVCTLQEAGYTGDYDVKLCGPEIEACDYWTLLEQSQSRFVELAPVAAQRTLA
jgi:sugar phosphate isomerase/epimerase